MYISHVFAFYLTAGHIATLFRITLLMTSTFYIADGVLQTVSYYYDGSPGNHFEWLKTKFTWGGMSFIIPKTFIN